MSTHEPTTPSSQDANPTLDAREFRRAMGKFATGITIVTTVNAEGTVHGMTANGFMSVSLSPPLVLISLGESTMATLLRETGRYGVSMLADEQRAYSQHFAGQASLAASPSFEWKDGMPFISEAVAHVGATVVDTHQAGDHTLFIGQVTHLATSEGRPLIFHGGSYELLRNKEEQELFFV